MTRSEALHSLHSPKGHCANCAREMPSSTDSALCIDCANVQKTRVAIGRSSPGLLNFLDLAKAKFPSAKLSGLALRNSAGQMEAIGALHQPEKPDGR